MKKCVALLAVVLMLMTSLIVLPHSVEASAPLTKKCLAESGDGWIEQDYEYGTGATTYFKLTNDGVGAIGVDDDMIAWRSVYRAFWSFDSTPIPDTAEVVSATMYVYFQSNGAEVMGKTVDVYLSNYGTLDVADWTAFTDLQCSFTITSAAGGWHSFALDPTSINAAGSSQYLMKLHDESITGADNLTFGEQSEQSPWNVAPYIVASYKTDVAIHYELTGGTEWSQDIMPVFAEWNYTFKSLTISADTWTGVENITIDKGASDWEFYGATPYYASFAESSTEVTLYDVLEGTTYQIMFSIPNYISSRVHVSIYIASTGEGLPVESFPVKYSRGTSYDATRASQISNGLVTLDVGNEYTLAVCDYFGNVITSKSVLINEQEMFINIPLSIFSMKLMNQQSDFIKTRMYYAGITTPIAWFNAPSEPVEKFVRAGAYTFAVTVYSNGVAGSTQWFNMTISDAEYLLISGDTIGRVISDVQGVLALQNVITSLIMPEIVIVQQNMPSAPAEEVIYVHPWSIVEATTRQNDTGTSMAFWVPMPAVAGCTYTVLEDRLYLSGTGTIYVNNTNGSAIYAGAMVPFIGLNGENITVEGSGLLAGSRDTEWRQEQLFYYAYYTTSKKYDVTLRLNNTMGMDWQNVKWFIGYPENRDISLSSVGVYDLDNDVTLTSGQHFDRGGSGVRMAFDAINISEARSFRFTMYDTNATSGGGVAIAYADSYIADSWNGEACKLASGTWTNTYSHAYDGEMRVKLDFAKASSINKASVHVYDNILNRELNADEWTLTDGVLTVGQISVGIGQAYSVDVYFLVDSQKDAGISLFAEVLPGVPIWMPLLIVITTLACWAIVEAGRSKKGKKATAGFLFAGGLLIIAVAMSGVLWYFTVQPG